MAKIFTLNEKMNGDHSILNGKMFIGKMNKNNELVFIDANTNKPIWMTTQVQSKKYVDNVLEVETKTGTLYKLVNVKHLLPTYELIDEVYEEETSEETIHDIKLMRYYKMMGTTSKKIIKGIDLYDQMEYMLRLIERLKVHYNIETIVELLINITEKDLINKLQNDESLKSFSTKINILISNILRTAGYSVDDNLQDIKFIGFGKFNTDKCKIIGFSKEFQFAHYCDQKDTYRFMFESNNLTDEDLEDFCIANNFRVNEQHAWFEPYSETSYNNDESIYVYQWIEPYTD